MESSARTGRESEMKLVPREEDDKSIAEQN